MLRRVGECILFAASKAVFMVVFYLWAALLTCTHH